MQRHLETSESNKSRCHLVCTCRRKAEKNPLILKINFGGGQISLWRFKRLSPAIGGNSFVINPRINESLNHMSEHIASIPFSFFLIKNAKPAGLVQWRDNEMVAGEITACSSVNQHDLRSAWRDDTFKMASVNCHKRCSWLTSDSALELLCEGLLQKKVQLWKLMFWVMSASASKVCVKIREYKKSRFRKKIQFEKFKICTNAEKNKNF